MGLSVFGTAGLPGADAGRMQGRIDALSKFGANKDGGVDRIAFSDADVAAREWLVQEMKALGLSVRIDEAANIIGRREGTEPELPAIMTGSHIDSVPGGGNYDGDLGVISALEVVEVLNAREIELRHPLEVISFTNEEGGLIGSLALSGQMTPETLAVVSQSGLTMAEGIDKVGGDSANVNRAAYGKGDLTAFIELHVEQGANLEEEEIDIGVVQGIVGIEWWDVVIEGVANHAGTTPMNRRTDALLAASELTLAINRVAREMPGRQVATVGRIEAFPGAPNVIPGKVVMSLEIRDLEPARIEEVFAKVSGLAGDIMEKSGATIRFEPVAAASEAALTDERLQAIISGSAERLGLTYKRMPSGAGHDTQDIAKIAPAGMIFVPSKGGISHSPREYTSPDEMANGADVLFESILAIDRGGLDR